ncbi:hypothetical protein PGQ11_010209 [Apiospora arundinis]|uniref:Uncharacterized protein n=1 Tax=Apiospora arundinis TaxID=335852 RepID=A0ABR2I9X8_9PEZI
MTILCCFVDPHGKLSSSSSVSTHRRAYRLPTASESPYANETTPAVTGPADVSAYSDSISPASFRTGTSSSATLSGQSASGHYSSAATAGYGTHSYIHKDSSTLQRDSQPGGMLANNHDYVPPAHPGQSLGPPGLFAISAVIIPWICHGKEERMAAL